MSEVEFIDKRAGAKKRNRLAVVLGGTGFIGSNLVERLKMEGWYVIAADINPEKDDESITKADEFYKVDLTDKDACMRVIPYETDRVYQLAADMGGAGYIFTGEHDAAVMTNSALINLNVAQVCVAMKVKKVFYSSSACMYPEDIQMDPENPGLKEEFAYPANPDSEYGWEKLFSERLWEAYHRNEGVDVRIARFHNIYGPLSQYDTDRAKAPAAISHKVITNKGKVQIWGDGLQTRSFLYIEDCLDAVELLMSSDTFRGPVNIGSEEMISILDFTKMIMDICGEDVPIEHIEGPLGVRGRNSQNDLIRKELGWSPNYTLRDGMDELIQWIQYDMSRRGKFDT